MATKKANRNYIQSNTPATNTRTQTELRGPSNASIQAAQNMSATIQNIRQKYGVKQNETGTGPAGGNFITDYYKLRDRDNAARESAKGVSYARYTPEDSQLQEPMTRFADAAYNAVANQYQTYQNQIGSYQQKYAGKSQEELQAELERMQRSLGGGQRRGTWSEAEEQAARDEIAYLNAAIGLQGYGDQSKLTPEIFGAWNDLSQSEDKDSAQRRWNELLYSAMDPALIQKDLDAAEAKTQPYESLSRMDRSRYDMFEFLDAMGIPIGQYSRRAAYTTPEYEQIKDNYNMNREEAERLRNMYSVAQNAQEAQRWREAASAPGSTLQEEQAFLSEMANSLKDYTDSDSKIQRLQEYAAQDDGFGLNEWAQNLLDQYQYNMKSGWEKFWGGVGDAAMAGIGSVDSMFATVPAAIGDSFGANLRDTDYYKFLKGNADYYAEQNEKSKNLYNNYTDSKIVRFLNGAGRGAVEGFVQSAPFLMLAPLTAAKTALQSAFAAANYTAGELLAYSGVQMLKNPGYWLSFAQEFGNQYDDAIRSGVDPVKATISGLVAGSINGGIEMGFGVQANVDDIMASKGFQDFMSEALESAIEEGGEELAQGFTGNVVDWLVWDKDKQAYSFDQNANAILNVPNMWEEFKGGFFGSWGFGGVQIVQSLYAGARSDTNKRRLMNMAHNYMSGEFQGWLTEHGSANAANESDYLAKIMSGQNVTSAQAEALRNSASAMQFLQEFTNLNFDEINTAEEFRKAVNGVANFVRTGKTDTIISKISDTVNEVTGQRQNQRAIQNSAEQIQTEAEGISAEDAYALAKVGNGEAITEAEAQGIVQNEAAAQFAAEKFGVSSEALQDAAAVRTQLNDWAAGVRAITDVMETAMRGDTISFEQATAVSNNAQAREYVASRLGIQEADLTDPETVRQVFSNQAAEVQVQQQKIRNAVRSEMKKISQEHVSLHPATGRVADGDSVRNVTVHDFADAKAGTVYTEDGGTAKLDSVAFDDSDVAAAYQQARRYDTDTANIFINGFRGQEGYAAAFDHLFRMGQQGVAGSISSEYAKVKDAIDLTTALAAYGRGKQNDTNARAITRTENVKGGGLVKDYSESKLNRQQRASVEMVDTLGKILGVTFVVHETGRFKTGGIVLDLNGFFNQNDNTVHLSLNSVDGLILRTAGHELTHFMKKWNQEGYEAYRDVLKEEIGEERWEQMIRKQQEIHKKNTNRDVSREYAEEEVVADASERYLNDIETFKKLADRNRTAAQKLLDALKEFIQKIKDAFSGKRGVYSEQSTVLSQLENFEQIRDQWADALGEAAETFRATAEDASVGNESNDIDFSIKSLSSAMGVQAFRDEVTGQISFFVDGEAVNHISSSDVRDSSGIGLLIAQSVKSGFISQAEAKTQYQAAADLMNMIMKTQDPELTWAWAGSSIFSALKKNSDGQYGTTIDFTTVCRKTQEMVTAMSSAMKRLGRGLTKAEVTQLQRRVLESGAEVPCPVCYVFSRWAGIGGMLDDIMRLQNKYADMSREESRQRVSELEQEIIDRGWGTKSRKGKWSVNGSAVTKLMQEKESQRMDLAAELEMLETAKRDTARQKELRSQIKDLDVEIGILSEWTWVKNIISRADYKPVPASILFDLDKGAEFAKNYAAVWKYRTTRGPSSGKAILPYSDMRFGDIIIGADKANKLTVTGTEYARKSPFVDAQDNVIAQGSFTSEQQKAYRSALLRTAAQNLIGGQRFQSTSDFRYEYALDYLQAFWELQALGSKMQTYTKVVEFADMVAAVGGDVNLSVMPKGRGYSNGKLVFSNVTGMNIDAALEANAKFDNAQLILVGINDEHILLALEDNSNTGGENIGFVIPYHASGASIEEFISELVQNLGEKFVKSNYQDYSTVQTDSQIKGATAEQKRRAEIRKLILQQKGASKVRNTLSEADMALIRGKSVDITGRSFEELRAVEEAALNGDEAAMREYLSWSAGVLNDLYEKMYNGAEKQTFLSSSQAASIMPHEYWNRNTTRANAYVNGFIFRSYCQSLGLHPRFTGWSSEGQKNFGDFSGSTGYWKTLIDRPMYANDGTYREQQRINVTKFDNAMLTPEYAERTYPDYKIQEPNRSRAERVGEAFAEEENVSFSLVTDQSLLRELEDQEHVTVYRAMQEIDGKLYPPMAAKVASEDGKTQLVQPTEIGSWYQSDERPDLIKNGKFTLNKGNGSSIAAAYNPYFHTSASPLNDQFSSAYKRPNLVVVQGVIPRSELTSGYKAEGAKDAVGETKWHAGPVASKLKGDKARRVFLSRYFKAERIVSDAEVARTVAGILEGENIAVPRNVVTPSLLSELRKQGVKIEGEQDVKLSLNNLDSSYLSAVESGNVEEQQRLVDEAAERAFADSKIRDEDGNLLKVYHGTDADFTVFDRSKGRSTMDIQGSFFSPWDIDAGGYGSNVRAFYLNITNPVPEGIAYRALNRFKGQNDAGIKAREYLESQGYDGVNNGDEEYIAFRSEQIKSADPVTYDDAGNVIPLSERFNPENVDIRFSINEALGDEYEEYQGRALVTEDTLDRWLKDYAASNPNYAQAYITYMTPDQFLRLTTTDAVSRSRIRSQSEGLTVQNAVEYSREQPVQLMINTETGKVEGHEGRHRMVAFDRAGIRKIPVLLFDSRNKYSKTAMDSLKLIGQDFNGRTNTDIETVQNVQPLSRGNRENLVSQFSTQTGTERVSERYGRQNVRFSINDSLGRELSEQQQKFFRDSVVRDENGNLIPMYHGTSNGGFNMFDSYSKGRYGLFGVGNYFTDNREVAEGYTKKGRGKNPQVYEVYLNITNPIDMDANADRELWMAIARDEDGLSDYFNGAVTNEDYFRALEEYCRDEEMYRYDAEEFIMDFLRSMGYDGITHIGGGRYNSQDQTRHRVYITFDGNQEKNVDNRNPTEESWDLRFSIKDPRQMTNEQAVALLTDVKKNKWNYADRSYIPIRNSTPASFVDAADYFEAHYKERMNLSEKALKSLRDRNPLSMEIGHAKSAMKSKEGGNRVNKEHPHGLSPAEIVEILDKTEDPLVVVYEANSDRLAAIVPFKKPDSSTAIAVVQAGEERDHVLMNGYKGETYNTTVTVYPGDDIVKVLNMLENEENILYFPSIMKEGTPQRSSNGSSSSLLNGIPSEAMISVELQKVKDKITEFQREPFISPQLRDFRGKTDSQLFEENKDRIKLTANENHAVLLYQEAVDKIDALEEDIKKLTELRDNAKSRSQRDGFQQDIYRKEGQLDTWREQMDLRSSTPEYRSALGKAARSSLDQLVEKYGSIKPGFNPQRDIQVPKKTSDNKKVRQTVRTVLESGAITDDMVDPIQRELLNETFSYTAISDESSKAYAENYIKENGYEGGMEAWERAIRGDKLVGKKDIAIAEYLLQMAAKDGNTADVIKLVGEIAAEGTRAGQTVQALSMLKKLSSIESVHLGELYYIKKAVDDINREIEKKNKNRRKPFDLLEIKQNLADAIVNAQTEEEATKAAQELMKDLGAQLPSTWIDKWNAWRYLSMLGNPRTHIRNIVGNAIFVPAVKLKNLIGTGLEQFVKGERTKSLRTTKEQRTFAANDFKEMEDVVSSGGKYNDTQSGIYAYKKVWKSKPGQILNFLAEKNSAFLEKEDWIFLRSHYISAMAQYMQANHIPVERMKENSPELEKARKYAIQEAQKATYRDASAVAQWLNKAEGIPVANLFVSGILPFKKTPINILKRGVEYSPLGLVKTLSKGVYDLRQGKITVNEWIDGIASGLSGTAVMALGMLLASLGVIQGGYDDDDEKYFDQLQGIQEYSFRIGDYTYTIDWAAPLSLPFFVGAEIFSAMSEESELTLKQILTAAQKITEPMFNLSMLSGLQDTLDAISYSNNKLTAVGTQVLSSYLSQAFPTIGGQIARTVDKTRYKNYTTKDGIIPKDLQYFLQSLLLKIPGGGYLAGLEASTDVWGEEQTNGDSILLRAFENFMSPGYIEKIESNEVETEIGRLYDETGDKGVLPDAGNKYLTVDGQRVYFSSSDYAKYEKMRGQMSYEILRDLIGTEMYQDLDGERKAYLMGLVYHYASYTSGNTVNPNYHPSSYGWADKYTASSLESGIPIETYLYFRMQKHFDAPNNKRDERVAVIDAMDIPADQKDVLYFLDVLAESKIDETPWH